MSIRDNLRRIVLAGSALVVFGLVAAACSSDDKPVTPPPASHPFQIMGDASVEGAKIVVTNSSNRTVEVTFAGVSRAAHQLQPGANWTHVLTPGTYTYAVNGQGIAYSSSLNFAARTRYNWNIQ